MQKSIKKIKKLSRTTDGAPNMSGPTSSFVNLFQDLVGHTIVGFHQGMLCPKVGTSDLKQVSEK